LTAGKLRFTAVFPAKQNRCLQTKEKLSPMPGIVCFFGVTMEIDIFFTFLRLRKRCDG
jgi:hypothetical protein